jgi:hypothetical protein
MGMCKQQSYLGIEPTMLEYFLGRIWKAFGTVLGILKMNGS